MPRSRNIKPGFFKNEELAQCPPLARILFVALWCEADREGLLLDRPLRLKAEYLPYDNCNCEELLASLAMFGLIVRYEVNGAKYIAIPKFCSHQNPHPDEKSKNYPHPQQLVGPGPTSGQQVVNKRQATGRQADDPVVTRLIPDSLFLDSLSLDSCIPTTEPSTSCSEADVAASEPLVAFPCVGKKSEPKEWFFTESHLAEWSPAYPGVDLLIEARKALIWVNANVKRRKTAKGMAAFITGWFSRSQNRGSPFSLVGAGNPERPSMHPSALDFKGDE